MGWGKGKGGFKTHREGDRKVTLASAGFRLGRGGCVDDVLDKEGAEVGESRVRRASVWEVWVWLR